MCALYLAACFASAVSSCARSAEPCAGPHLLLCSVPACRVVVVLEFKIYVYNFADLKLLDHIEVTSTTPNAHTTPRHWLTRSLVLAVQTTSNPKGLCALCPYTPSTVLVCPGLQKGSVRVELYDTGIRFCGFGRCRLSLHCGAARQNHPDQRARDGTGCHCAELGRHARRHRLRKGTSRIYRPALRAQTAIDCSCLPAPCHPVSGHADPRVQHVDGPAVAGAAPRQRQGRDLLGRLQHDHRVAGHFLRQGDR